MQYFEALVIILLICIIYLLVRSESFKASLPKLFKSEGYASGLYSAVDRSAILNVNDGIGSSYGNVPLDVVGKKRGYFGIVPLPFSQYDPRVPDPPIMLGRVTVPLDI